MAQWRVTTPAGTTINDITFTDRYNGYAVFQSSGIGNCIVSHGLYKTIDEGKNWVRMNTGNTNVINAVHFVNKLTGWFTGASSDIRKTTDGGATWVQQSSGVGSGNNDIWFIDANTGFVIGNNGILRKSTNGGASWQTITSGVTVTLRRIFFANNNLGFIACSNGQILRTTNGGTNWNIVTTGAGGINDVFFADASNGYISSGSNLFKTTDGGLTWFPVVTGAINPIIRIFFTSINSGYLSVDGEGIFKTTDAGLTWSNTTTLNGLYDTFYAIYFTDNNTGYVGGTLGRINKTTDAGASWKNRTTGLGTELFTVNATHKDTAYAGSYEGKIYKTENGGVTYFQQTRAFSTAINKLYFTSNDIGFACSDSGRILKTTDGGNHWLLKPTNTLRGFTDMSFINPTKGFVSAAGGMVFKTTDGGETWDSISTGITDYYKAIWFINEDTGFVAGSNKIVRTFDGGATWDVHISTITSSISDIVFTNDSLGYCAGTFGKILFTTDAGLNWYPTNNNSSNAEINEMWFANDSVGYFSRLTSQSITLDSCKTLGSIPTACLANNWSMNSISMTDDGAYGYNVGGLNGIIHQTSPREIYETYTSTGANCVGEKIFIAYYARGFYGVTNVFTAELSDASGSFATPVVIGTYTAVATTYQSGIITATLPIAVAPGNYKIRVIATDPSTVGPEIDITILPSFNPTITLSSNAQGTMCAGSTLVLSTTNFAGGLNPVYSWTINGNSMSNNASNLIINTLQDGDTVQVSMQSNLTCANNSPVLSNVFIASVSTGLPLTLANDTTVCQSSSIQLSSPAGYSYSWSPSMGLNNANIANPVAVINGDITYNLTITDASGCVGIDSISITSNPLPQLNLGNNQTVCANSVVQLNGPVGYSYNWLPAAGLDNPSIANPMATITGNIAYALTITDGIGCTATDSIFFTANTLPTISFSSDTMVCENECFILIPIISGNLQSISWSPGLTLNDSTINTPTACPIVNTSYTVTATDINQCTATSNINVAIAALPIAPVITFTGGELASTPAYSYQWYVDNNLIPGANSMTVFPIGNGYYTVEISNSNGCTAVSDSILVVLDALVKMNGSAPFQIAPNPVFDAIHVTLNTNEEITRAVIFNASGAKVFEQNGINAKALTIDVKHFSAGVYMVVIDSKSSSFKKRIQVVK